MSTLDKLNNFTKIVIDTGDINSIKKYKPIDATTNPSLLLAACKMSEYEDLIKKSITEFKSSKLFDKNNIKHALEILSVNFAVEILKIIEGRVSIEVDASQSFNKDETIKCAHRIIDLLKDRGISKDRVLIKIASTWEGIGAAKELEKEGIHCNLTLLFSMTQAIACAEAKVTLISPFVGRIFDWYKNRDGVDGYASSEDPGVVSVTNIFNYYKKFNVKTEIMGASFRNIGEIIELAGCDLLTIAPKLLQELSESDLILDKKLDADKALGMNLEKIEDSEVLYRWGMNEDEMATVKLSEGIRNFNTDWNKLSDLIKKDFL